MTEAPAPPAVAVRIRAMPGTMPFSVAREMETQAAGPGGTVLATARCLPPRG